MEVSLLHRFCGVWFGLQTAIASQPSLSEVNGIAQDLWQELLIAGEWELKGENHYAGRWLSEPLMNALALIPVFLFYHEDPDYLADRLERRAMGGCRRGDRGAVVRRFVVGCDYWRRDRR